MKKGRISAAVLLLVAYLLVQYAECKNNGTEGHFLVDGIDVEKLSDDEVRDLLDAEDVKFTGQLDIWIGKQSLKERHRIKRVAPIVARVAWMAGRALYRSLSHKVPHITRSGGRMTKQYFKNGGYWSARRDFNRFKPTGVTQFRGRTGQKGYTGKILDGKYQLTVRKKSSFGRPTLEIRSNTGGKVVRKVRYE